MNILQLEDTIKGLPDEALMQEAQQPSGQVPQFLVISEVQRRSDMRKRHQQQSQEQPQGTVADQVLQEGIAGMAPPSPGMQQAMGGPPTQMMYGGGVVRMQNMGQVPFYPDLASRGFGPSVGDMQQKINMLLESGVSTEDIISIIGEDDYKRAGFRMPTTQAAGLDLSGMNVPVGADLVADLGRLSETNQLIDDIAAEPEVIPSAGFVGSAAQISEQPGNRYSSEFTDVLDEIRMGRTPSEKELSYPSLEIDPRLNLAQQEVLGIPRGSVTVEELGVRGPSNLEDLLAMATGSAGERVQQKIDATNASNAIKEDARKAKLDKRANRVSDSEYAAVANTNADMYATITNPRAGRETSTQEVIGKGHQDRLIKNQEAMDIVRELSSQGTGINLPSMANASETTASSVVSPSVVGGSSFVSGRPGARKQSVEVPGADPSSDDFRFYEVPGADPSSDDFRFYEQPGVETPAVSSSTLGMPTLDAKQLEELQRNISRPSGPEAEIDAAVKSFVNRPDPGLTRLDLSGIDTDYSGFDQAETYSRLIEEQKVLADRARQEAKRDAGSMALVQLGAGIAAGDLSKGLSEAGSTAYDVRTAGRKEAREAEAAARALELSKAKGTQELGLLGRQAETEKLKLEKQFEAENKADVAKLKYAKSGDEFTAIMRGIMDKIQITRFADLKRQVDEAAYRQIMDAAMTMTELEVNQAGWTGQGNLADITAIFASNVATSKKNFEDLRSGRELTTTAPTPGTGTGAAGAGTGAGAGAGSSDRFNIENITSQGGSS